jgi:predicted nucleic acid-binding protein
VGRFLPDSNCIIAVLSAWHPRHSVTLLDLDGRRQRGDTMIVAAHSALEAFSVLTRMPSPWRVTPAEARTALEGGFLHAEMVALDVEGYRALIQDAPTASISGGQLYDALLVACAVRASVDTIVTFNLRHFQQLVPPGMSVVAPQ